MILNAYGIFFVLCEILHIKYFIINPIFFQILFIDKLVKIEAKFMSFSKDFLTFIRIFFEILYIFRNKNYFFYFESTTQLKILKSQHRNFSFQNLKILIKFPRK